jgi:hypothetical protein
MLDIFGRIGRRERSAWLKILRGGLKKGALLLSLDGTDLASEMAAEGRAWGWEWTAPGTKFESQASTFVVSCASTRGAS